MEKLILAITNKMQFYSNDMQYEIAANLRNLKDGLSIINKVLYSHEDILSKDIILKIPINSGYKLFYVKSGLVYCGNNKDLNDFSRFKG